jgi:hypothetical protein
LASAFNINYAHLSGILNWFYLKINWFPSKFYFLDQSCFTKIWITCLLFFSPFLPTRLRIIYLHMFTRIIKNILWRLRKGGRKLLLYIELDQWLFRLIKQHLNPVRLPLPSVKCVSLLF